MGKVDLLDACVGVGEDLALGQLHNRQIRGDVAENIRVKSIKKKIFAVRHWVRSSAIQAALSYRRPFAWPIMRAPKARYLI